VANTDIEFIYTVEDYSAATTSSVVDAGQARWFDTVTGFPAARVFTVVGDGSSTIAELVAYQGKYDVIDTDGGDVGATAPTDLRDGQEWIVTNSGSSGNHVTGLPGTISLGDGKTIVFIYDDDNTAWRYEDVIIDEDTSLNAERYAMWAGGRMEKYGEATASATTASSNAFGTTAGTVYYAAIGRTFTTGDFVGNVDITFSSNGYAEELSSLSVGGFGAFCFHKTTGTSITLRYNALGRWKA